MSESLVERAIAAHGGAAGMAAGRPLLGRLRLRCPIVATRFRWPLERGYELGVDTRRPHATLRPFHGPDRVGVFDGDEVRIETVAGARIAARTGARAHARGHVFWDDLDLLYFLGYALWNYAMTPYYFTWPGFATRELGERRLEVTYPEGFPTHCRVQTFYFDERFLLTRLDYSAEIFRFRTVGAHLCHAPRDYGGGLIYPSHRRVVRRKRNGEPGRGPAVMEGWIDSIELG